MRLFEAIGEQVNTFTVLGIDGVQEIQSITLKSGTSLSLDDDVEPWFSPEQLEIQRLLKIIEKRDNELSKYKAPRQHTRRTITDRNDVLDMAYHNPTWNQTMISQKLDMPSSFVSKIIRGEHTLSNQQPVWVKPE